jgi:decaprenylphospho-beta-D-ribofuranose 2-oxidase
VIARGLGRSYGDAAQNAGGTVLDMTAFTDPVETPNHAGEVSCHAGLSIGSLLQTSVPAGWFIPVSPGTRHVTLGGAIAADVHGKNHHRDGSIGRHVARLELVDGSGVRHVVGPGDALFDATLGGMGLTGLITRVDLRMTPIESAWLAVDGWRTTDLDETMSRLRECDSQFRYSVAWIDACAAGSRLGRGFVTAADHLPRSDLPRDLAADPLGYRPKPALTLPPGWPVSAVGPRQTKVFNAAYYRRSPRTMSAVPTSIAAFFHPLDRIGNWNRAYGPHGFVQYQFVTPSADTLREVLVMLQTADAAPALAVLKRFGAATTSPLSFPQPGWTVALDLPAGTPGLAATLDRADLRVAETGGRVYLAKDARLDGSLLTAMYPGLDAWREIRATVDPHGVFQSDLARRLHL